MRSSLVFMASAIATVVAQTPIGFTPSTNNTFSVNFGDSAIVAGQAVPIQQATTSPTISFTGLADNSSYIVLMVDLDAPAGIYNNSFSPLLHWLTPIPSGSTSLPGNQSLMAAPAPYGGPQPPPGTGKHRYVLLLLANPASSFTWPPKWKDFRPAVIEDRLLFNIQEFVQAGNFRLLAANWFTAENITTVPTAGAMRVSTLDFGVAASVVACFTTMVLAFMY